MYISRINYYDSLCVEMYEILHKNILEDELKFYLSYAQKDNKILEPLCGSGRFFVEFIKLGFDICGVDISKNMLYKLLEKSPTANVIETDICEFVSNEKFDYIFIPSSSVSLFTDIIYCKNVLKNLKNMLSLNGKFVFSVDTISAKCQNNDTYKVNTSVKTKEGFSLVLKNKSYYDEKSRTQFYPSIYELYDGSTLIQSEYMDFQIHLYEYGEMDMYLKEIGFHKVNVYTSFDKKNSVESDTNMLLYECWI